MPESQIRELTTPLDEKTVRSLRIGDKVSFTGILYAARDAAHKRMVEALQRGEKLPFDPAGAVIYYVGPTPGESDTQLGSAGPTTSGRMDAYAPEMLRAGVRGMIGKGNRNNAVIDAIKVCGAVYFAATGGAGALLGQRIAEARIVAYEDLGPEAVRELKVENFPAIVAIDSLGRSLYSSTLEMRGL